MVVTRDVPGLFSLIAGTLAAHGINIMSAQIHTRADGIAIDTFQVNDPAGEAVTSAAHWRRTMEALGRGDRRARCPWTMLLERRRARPGAAARRARRRRRSRIDNELSDVATVIEVKCPDRVGLLYLITRTLSGARPRHRERAHRHRDRPGATTRSTCTTAQGQKLEQPDAMDARARALEQALVQPL